MTKILVPLAEGFEMVEALSVVDVFRRAGAHVDVAAVDKKQGGKNDLQVTSSHQVTVTADCNLEDCKDNEYDLIVLPGGIPGAENLQKSEILNEMLLKQNLADRYYGAICASPALVLEQHGLLKGKKATCHPGFVDRLSSQENVGEKVVTDGKCVTGRGAGVSIEFALELVEALMGIEKRKEVEKGLALL